MLDKVLQIQWSGIPETARKVSFKAGKTSNVLTCFSRSEFLDIGRTRQIELMLFIRSCQDNRGHKNDKTRSLVALNTLDLK